MVTLEVALALPLLMVAVVAGSFLLAAGASQARLTDAARATARELARGTSPDAAVTAGRSVAPDADIVIASGGRDVTVSARRQLRGPGPVLGFLHLTLTATAVTTQEQPW